MHSPSAYAYSTDHINALLLNDTDFEEKVQFKKKLTTKVPGLEPGNYQIVYSNKYGEFSRTRFKLKKGQRNVPITLNYEKLDSVMYLGKRKIDSLQNGDSLRVYFQSSGCFHHYKKNIVYFRENDQLYGTNFSDTVLIDSVALAKIRMFETELVYPHIGGCTTMSTYVVYLNGKEVMITMDDSCGWSGYFRYLAGVFPKSEEE